MGGKSTLKIYTDDVMGGKSTLEENSTPSSDEYIHLIGEVTTENNGGFVRMGYPILTKPPLFSVVTSPIKWMYSSEDGVEFSSRVDFPPITSSV